MSDPFGDDDIDFDVSSFTNAAYSNAVAYLADERPISRMARCQFIFVTTTPFLLDLSDGGSFGFALALA